LVVKLPILAKTFTTWTLFLFQDTQGFGNGPVLSDFRYAFFGTFKNSRIPKNNHPTNTKRYIKTYLSGNRNRWLEITNVAIPFFGNAQSIAMGFTLPEDEKPSGMSGFENKFTLNLFNSWPNYLF